jgi:hypothetical protein
MASHSSRSAHRAARLRDAGLRKVSIATRFLVVGAVAAGGAFSAMAAWAQPGRSKTTPAVGQTLPTSSVGSGTSATVPATIPPAGSSDDGGGLTPPSAAPTTVPAQSPSYQNSPPSYPYAPPVVVSGAS